MEIGLKSSIINAQNPNCRRQKGKSRSRTRGGPTGVEGPLVTGGDSIGTHRRIVIHTHSSPRLIICQLCHTATHRQSNIIWVCCPVHRSCFSPLPSPFSCLPSPVYRLSSY